MENFKKYDQNDEKTPFTANFSKFLENYKNSDRRIYDILALSDNPSSKLSLLSLAFIKAPLTTKELNCMTSRKLTFENYKKQFEPYIDYGAVILVSKRVGGINRQAFDICYDKLINYVGENDR